MSVDALAQIKKDLGQRLKKARDFASLTQEELGKLVAIFLKKKEPFAQSTIGSIENGDRFPSLELLIGLCTVLQIHPRQVFDFQIDGLPYNEVIGKRKDGHEKGLTSDEISFMRDILDKMEKQGR